MIAKDVSLLYATAVPALGDHLWQSTLFAIIAGLLTLTLRKNGARARYGLWLAASLKFLIPFSLLAAAGEHLAWLRDSVRTNVRLYGVAGQLGDPFTQSSTQAISRTASSAASPGFVHFLPVLFPAFWLAGFAVAIFFWFLRWRRISISARTTAPSGEGREMEVLRRVERRLGVRNPIDLRLSTSSMEPGVFGIVHPILVWPERISPRLDDGQLESILAHEVWHVRRRDNLTAAMHMVVEALFWFHPLIWWLGTRLQGEREHACDEEVIQMCGEPRVYAEGILKVCEFCVGSPLTCVSGVTGADLKKRIVRIMRDRVARRLDFSRKLLLSVAGLAAVAVPIVLGLANAPLRAQSSAPQGPTADWQTAAGGKMAFDVASVKQNKSGLPPSGDSPNSNMPMGNGASYPPNGGLFTATNIPLSSYIAFAYKMDPNQLKIMANQLPKWAKTERFDIQARRAGDPTKDQMRLMLQSVLADRFKLTIHTEIRQLPVFSLAVIKDGKFGPQLKPHSDDASCTTTTSPFAALGASSELRTTVAEGFPTLCDGFSQMPPSTPGRLRIGARRVTMAFIATTLPFWEEFDRPVVDSTGLGGTYDFFLEWTPEIKGPLPPGATFQPDPTGPTFLEALKEQLGLKLDSQTGPVDAFVIDQIEEPSEN